MNTVSRPLARAQPSGAACLSLPSTGHNSPDPIALHMQAGTQLPEPLHGCALQDLAAAQQAIAALQSIDLPLVGGKPCKPPKKTRCRRGNTGQATPRIYPPAYYAHWAQCRPAQPADQPQSTPFGQ